MNKFSYVDLLLFWERSGVTDCSSSENSSSLEIEFAKANVNFQMITSFQNLNLHGVYLNFCFNFSFWILVVSMRKKFKALRRK